MVLIINDHFCLVEHGSPGVFRYTHFLSFSDAAALTATLADDLMI